MKTTINEIDFIINNEGVIEYPRLNFASKNKEGSTMILCDSDYTKKGIVKSGVSKKIEQHYYRVSEWHSILHARCYWNAKRRIIRKAIVQGALQVTKDNYHEATVATYTKVAIDFFALLQEAKQKGWEYYEQEFSSSYVIKDGIVYRHSDHWVGKECDCQRSCLWYLQGDDTPHYTPLTAACPLDSFQFNLRCTTKLDSLLSQIQ